MRIIMPFNYIDDYYWERFKSQIQPIANRVDGFTIVANAGVKPKDTGKVRVVIYSRDRQKRGLPELAVRYFLSIRKLSIIRKIYFRNLIAEYFKRVDGDLVYGLSGGAYQQFIHIFLKQKLGVPAVHRMRGNAKLELEYVVEGFARFIRGYLSDYTMLRYDWHIPINTQYYNMLSNYRIPRERISSPIGLGVDTNKFTPRYESDRFTVGYFGRIFPEKGIDFMLRVMRKTPEIRYLVVGKDMMGVEFPENVEYHRPVLHKNIPQYYAQVDIMMLPSYAEGVSNIFLEAYASGKPMICSNAAHSEDLPLYGFKLPHKLKAWVKTLRNLDKDKTEELGTQARLWAEGYTWEDFAEKMITEFKKVIEDDYTLDRAHGLLTQPVDTVPRARSNP